MSSGLTRHIDRSPNGFQPAQQIDWMDSNSATPRRFVVVRVQTFSAALRLEIIDIVVVDLRYFGSSKLRGSAFECEV